MLLNKLVLVTGGSSGIGRATCIACAEEGAQVIVADINKAEALETVVLLKGTEHMSCVVDVSLSETVNRMADQIQLKYKRIPNALVHCAGILIHKDGIQGCTEERWDKIMAVNLKGTYLINRKFGLLMKENKQPGSIVNISSISSLGSRWSPDYAATKAGQIAFTKSIAKEWAEFGIRVNCIRPGSIDTAISAHLIEASSDVNQLRPQAPIKRDGTAAEVAQVAVFLVSDKSSYVTSCEYDVHGGFEMHM